MFAYRMFTTLFAIVFISQAWAGSHGHSEGHNHSGEDVSAMNPWTRAVPMAGMNAAGYMMLKNSGDKAITLVSFKTDASAKTSLHETVKSGDMVSMKALPKGITIPANGTVELKPGGLHLMFMKLKQPFAEGDEIPVTLIFDSGKEITTSMVVKPIGTTESHGKMHH